jgi:ribose transport system ATP-binding protein
VTPVAHAGDAAHHAVQETATAWVSVRNLSKTFGSTTALRGVDLDVLPGEVHGLVGQNGSGKSTLIKILSGVHAADAGGSVTVAGKPLSNPARPAELHRHGLAFVHQDLGLAGDQSVTENVRLGQYRVSRIIRRIDWRAEAAATRRTLEQLHSSIEPSRLVSSLTPGERAVVAIARALQNLTPGSGCVVFDESTQSLPREVLPEFYATARALAARGTAVIIVSHRLDEIMTLTDRVTVLQDGRVVASGVPTSTLTEGRLARLVLGREAELERDVDAPKPTVAPVASRAVRLRVRSLRTRTLRDFDLDVREGEIVGVTGPTNGGHEEIAYALGGVLGDARGSIAVDDTLLELPVRGPRVAIEAGLALVPEQRLREGLADSLSARENLTLPRVDRRGRGLLRSAWQDEEFARAVAMLGIVPSQPHLPISAFSGGNQQKMMFAKWLLNEPRVLLLHEPTQGVDVGARVDLLRAVEAAALRGASVVVCSIEPQDLAFICDRVIVVRDGQAVRELSGHITASDITSAVYDSATASGETRT